MCTQSDKLDNYVLISGSSICLAKMMTLKVFGIEKKTEACLSEEIMNTELAEKSVGCLVSEKASRAKIFEKYGIDYCCGGKESLESACKKKGISLDKLIDELEHACIAPDSDQDNYSTLSISSLIDHILEVHHAFLESELPRLSQLMKKVASVHGEKRPELKRLSELFHMLKSELEQHTMKEEQILFPMCKQLEKASDKPQFHCGTVCNPIRVMEYEHNEAGTVLAEMRRITDGYKLPEDACGSYKVLFAGLSELESDLHVHIHKENNILFPAVKELEAVLN